MRAFLFGGSNDGLEVEVNEHENVIRIPIMNSYDCDNSLTFKLDTYIKCDAIFRKDYFRDRVTAYSSFKEMGYSE